MIKNNFRLVFAFLLVFMMASGVSALSVYTQFDNQQQSATINSGESINYDVAAIADQDTNWMRVTGKLYRNTGSGVELVKQLFSDLTYETNYFPSTKSIVPADYVSAGNYFIDVVAEEQWNDGTITSRSSQLYLVVNPTYTNSAPVADFMYVPQNPTTQDTVVFTSNSTDDHGIILEEWFVNGVKIGEGRVITKLFTQQGNYAVKLRVTDSDGVQSDKLKNIFVSNVVTNHAPVMQQILNQAIFENAQTYEYQLQVSDQDNDPLTCYKISGPSWISVNGQTCKVVGSSIPQVVQDTNFDISVGVSDGSLSDQKSYVLTVKNVYQNVAPVAAYDYTPSNPETSQEVTFDGSDSYDSDGYIASYVWDFGTGDTATGMNVNYAFPADGSYQVSLTVTDNAGASDSEVKTIVVTKPSLVIDELYCNPDVVVGHQQHCSAHVKDNVSGAEITFKLASTNQVLAQCVTNFKGYCHVNPEINLAAGDYSVFAEARKSGYLSDLSGELRTNFKVWAERYDIANLKVYEDQFITENYTFYRATPMYVSFDVVDLITGETISPSQGLIDDVFLRVNNNFTLNFSRFGGTDEYKYYLTSIPISDDFLGQGNVYAFVFNFSDNTAGQEDVIVNVLNNPLEFNPPAQIHLDQGASILIDFNQYLVDVETPLEDILLSYVGAGNVLSINEVGNKIYNVSASNNFEGNASITFTADDTDGSVVSKQVVFTVNPVVETHLPIAVLDMPESVYEGKDVILNASRSYDPDGEAIVSYKWSVYREGTLVQSWTTSSPVTNYLFSTKGQYTVYLTVVNEINEQGNTSRGLFAGRNNPQTVFGKEDGLYLENYEIVGSDWGVVKVGEPFVVRATVTNDRERSRNLRLRFTVPEIGFVAESNSFTLDRGDTEDIQFYVELPFDASEVPPGDYISTIGVSNTDIIRNKYFPLLIE